MDWVTFLKVMIEDEKAAIEKYQLAIEQADSKKLKTVLERLRDEEEIDAAFASFAFFGSETATGSTEEGGFTHNGSGGTFRMEAMLVGSHRFASNLSQMNGRASGELFR